jgi:hypothetical protein
MRSLFFAVALAACTFFAGWGAALDRPPSLSSLAGENLQFRVLWGFIPAGEASLRVIDAGDGRITFRAEARSLPYIDTVYPVRDTIESTLLVEGSKVLRFYKRSKEGHGREKEEEVLFDTAQGIAHLYRPGKPLKTLLVPPGVQDPLSCFYYYRSLDLPADREVSFDITDGSKLTTGTVRVIGREEIETPAGVFRCVIVEPKVEGIGGIFGKSPGARILIWLTDDGWRRPIKLQSNVVIGHFTAELVRGASPEPPPRGPK